MVTSPLSGTTVVDFTHNIAGPFASLVLRDLGARVIKVEPVGGDDARTWPPFVDGVGTAFAAFNRGKESIAINAKAPEGREQQHRMVERADVFLESMRPGKAAALGLGWEDLERINPRLVYCSINAFGDEGPMATAAGFDAIIQAYSGIMDLTGYPDADPCRVGTATIDVGTGMWSALAIMGALMEPDPARRGGRVQTTMLGTAVSFMMHQIAATALAGQSPTRIGTAQHNFAPYQAVHTRDRMVMLGVNSDRMFERFCQAIGDDGRICADSRFDSNAGRMANREAMVEQIESLTLEMSAPELVERLSAVGIPASEVRTVSDLVADPQLTALDLWRVTDEGYQLPRIPVDLATGGIGEIAAIGQHTAELLAELGFANGDVEQLAQQGVVTTR
jgi:CoA:oxalate CoA-transferase